ncbi:MAG: MarR family transcriptional regulator [Rhodanobacteraceae bacterium]|nr:MAG: MarR family transcriptional regulator [Rhodanobacteraceae bacterium]
MAKHPRKPRPRGIREAPAVYSLPAQSTGGLADALFTTTQQRVLGALYGQPQRSFTVSELIDSTGAGSGAVQRELAKLIASGLLTMQPVGNQKRYQANPAAPIHDELVGIVQKTVGLAEPLRTALQSLASKIIAAFVFGSVAKRSDTAQSDIDVMIVSGKLGYAEALTALAETEEQLGRKVIPTIYSPAELAKRIKTDNAFIKRVLEQPKIWLIGGEDDLHGKA